MSAALRHLAIERALVDWFRRDGWEVSGRLVTKYDDDFGDEVTINLEDLASELDSEWDHIGGGK